jgi:hypothetical protein
MGHGLIKNKSLDSKYSIENTIKPKGWWVASAAYKDVNAIDPCSISLGDSCYTLKDISGNNNHIRQPTSLNRPIWKSNAVNGNPSLVFDGINKWIGGSTNGIISSPSYDWLFLMVFRQLSWSINDQIWNNGTQYFRQNTSTPNLGISTASDWTDINSGQWVVMSFRGLSYDATNLGTRQYRNLEQEKTSVRKAGGYGNFSSLSLGGSNTGTVLSNIEFAEAILFFNIIDDNLHQSYINMLIEKYNIT